MFQCWMDILRNSLQWPTSFKFSKQPNEVYMSNIFFEDRPHLINTKFKQSWPLLTTSPLPRMSDTSSNSLGQQP